MNYIMQERMWVVVVLLGSIRNKEKNVCVKVAWLQVVIYLFNFLRRLVLIAWRACVFVNLLRKFKVPLNNVILKGEFLWSQYLQRFSYSHINSLSFINIKYTWLTYKIYKIFTLNNFGYIYIYIYLFLKLAYILLSLIYKTSLRVYHIY